MTPRTAEELRRQYGPDVYLVVAGSKGDKCPDPAMSESEAIAWYERDGGKAVYTVACVPSETKGRICHRGWIRDGWKWIGDGDSLAVDLVDARKKPASKWPPAARCSVRATKANIVVTDPCYLLSGDDWGKFVTQFAASRIKPQITSVHGVTMLLADTIYGDWLCELRGTSDNRAKEFGQFTADSGTVCVAVEPTTAMMGKLCKLPPRCWTGIPAFSGKLTLSHERGKCHVRGSGTSNGSAVKFTSRQIG